MEHPDAPKPKTANVVMDTTLPAKIAFKPFILTSKSATHANQDDDGNDIVTAPLVPSTLRLIAK
jgi:hypothetical protein